jgi:hypothetical protein
MNGGGSADMTLAFELDALEALAEPSGVFDDARGWSQYVGVVSEKPTYVVTNFTRKNRIRQDFFSGPRGKSESLENVKGQFETDRHVFVGVGAEDEALAEETDWEFLPIETAADAAGWELADSAAEPDPEPEESREDWP